MRVLLADDKSWSRSALRLWLENEEEVVVVAEEVSIQTLPHRVTDLRPDLLFLDWRLSGLETNRARQEFTNTMHTIDPNLYIIALVSGDHEKSCLHFGADAFVDKSESPDRIHSVLLQATSVQANRNKSSSPSLGNGGYLLS